MANIQRLHPPMPKHGADTPRVGLLHDPIGDSRTPVRGNQHKVLAARQAAFGRDAAALARQAGQIAPAIVRFQELRLIGFEDSVQIHWPVAETSPQLVVSPQFPVPIKNIVSFNTERGPSQKSIDVSAKRTKIGSRVGRRRSCLPP